MSDYIRKSALIEDVHKIRCQNGISEEVGHNRPLTDIANVFECINNQPTISETEFLHKAFERVVERFRNEGEYARYAVNTEGVKSIPTYKAIEIVKEECGISE